MIRLSDAIYNNPLHCSDQRYIPSGIVGWKQLLGFQVGMLENMQYPHAPYVMSHCTAVVWDLGRKKIGMLEEMQYPLGPYVTSHCTAVA